MLRQFPSHLCTKCSYIARIISYGWKALKVLVQAHIINSVDTSFAQCQGMRKNVKL